VRRGLRTPVQSFFSRRKIRASIAELVPEAKGSFDRAQQVFLFHVPDMPARLFPLFEQMPGVEIYHTYGRNIFVQRGWRHPFALENCRRFFRDNTLYFFSGSRDAVETVLAERIDMIDIEHFKAQQFRAAVAPKGGLVQDLSGQPDATMQGQPVGEALIYRVDLVPTPAMLMSPVTAALIESPRELAWLKRIVFSLPRTALETYKAAFTNRGALIVNDKGIELMPLGIPLKEAFPKVYIPSHMRFSPPLSQDNMTQMLGIQPGRLYILPHGMAHAFEVEEGMLRSLDTYLLADLEVEPIEVTSALATSPVSAAGQPLESQPIGRFALWRQNILRPGLVSDKGARALPPSASSDDA